MTSDIHIVIQAKKKLKVFDTPFRCDFRLVKKIKYYKRIMGVNYIEFIKILRKSKGEIFLNLVTWTAPDMSKNPNGLTCLNFVCQNKYLN